MTDRRCWRAAFAALAAAALPLAPASARDGWTASAAGTEAGYTVGSAFAGLRFACPADGSVRMIFNRNGSTFDRTREHTAVISVDGTAHLFRTRAVFDREDGGDDFVRSAPWSEFAALIAALKAGRAAEISLPSGRYLLPLNGSSRALAAFAAACGHGADSP